MAPHGTATTAFAAAVVLVVVLALAAPPVAAGDGGPSVRQSSSSSSSPSRGGYAAAQCCGQRTFQVTSSAYEPVAIDQNTVFVRIQAYTQLGQSNLAVQRAIESTNAVLQILNSGNFSNVTNVQQVTVQVENNNNFTCDSSGCRNVPIGFIGTNTISFNAPLANLNNINVAILAVRDTTIQSQQGFVPPEIFGAAQNIAIRRALTYAQYRADQTVSGLPNFRIGPPLHVVVSANDYLNTGGSANGAVQGTADVTFELLPL